jgi:ParB family chromosome partitioning protein
MANNNHGLGRGLASLIPQKNKSAAPNINTPQNFSQEPTKAAESLQDDFLEVAVGKIATNPQQPRHHFDEKELQELADSIKEHGIIQPLVVTKIAPEQYELIAGERRLKAAKLAGLAMVPVIVREETGEKEKLELALIENIQRHDLNVLEEARAYKKLMEEFDLTQEDIAARVAKSRSAVANKIRLLNLPIEIQRALQEGKITEGHARSILALENPERQRALFEMILKENLTVRETEEKVKEVTVATHQRKLGSSGFVSEYKEKEEQMAGALGTKVKIKKAGKGGKIIIDFYSPEELENISSKLSQSV